MSDLSSLSTLITSLGLSVKSLKDSAAPASEISSAVASLLKAKTDYASMNNGIGIDGKPFDAKPMSSADKKKAAKAEKTTAAADSSASASASASSSESSSAPPPPPSATTTGGQEKNPENEAKLAAKKAEKKAKAAEAKSSVVAGGDAVPPPPVASAAPAPAASKPAAAASAAPITPAAPTPTISRAAPPTKTVQYGKLEPLQLCWSPNPNCPTPQITLLTASFLHLTPDLKLKMDIYRTSDCVLGANSPNSGTYAPSVISGDVSIARYFCRFHPRSDVCVPFLGGSEPAGQANVDCWVDLSIAARATFKASGGASGLSEILETVEAALESTKSLGLSGSSSYTLADVCVFVALEEMLKNSDVLLSSPSAFPRASRWHKSIQSSPASSHARQLLVGIDDKTELYGEEMDTLFPGCHMLEGARCGQVTTRFPPEPSGYLHIGHAKAVLLNDYYAKRYKGKLIVRFDDTNPSKEKEEFQNAIVEDLAKLGVYPSVVTFTSDYFEELQQYAIELIETGQAYMDDTPQEEMQKERLARENSRRRNLTPEESRKYFDMMCSGSAEGGKWCLRGKVNMQSLNGTMRDPFFCSVLCLE